MPFGTLPHPLPLCSFSGILNRNVSLYALRRYSPDPFDIAGSIITGGRYNPPGTFAVLYLAQHVAIAAAETRLILATGSAGSVSIEAGPNTGVRVDVAIALNLQYVLDLHDPAVRDQLGVTLPDLLHEWFPVQLRGELATTQQIGAAVHAPPAAQAIRYPSARFPGGWNLAVFAERVAEENRVLQDAENIHALMGLHTPR